jgi:soluble lytic murein transglycosylase-like protein
MPIAATRLRFVAAFRRSAPSLAMIALLAALAAGLSTASSTHGPPSKPAPRKVAKHRVAAARPKPVVPAAAVHAAVPSAFAQEAAMGFGERMNRWNPLIKEASRRFGVPEIWIRAVMTIESGGRTMLGENIPMASGAGAMGLMQVMPQTWQQMRRQYGLGANPHDPQDNILAGTAYLSLLYRQYGYPGLFAAYNDGPGMLEAHRRLGQLMPAETTAYVLDIASILSTGVRRSPRLLGGVADPQAGGGPAQGAMAAIVLIPATMPSESAARNDSDDGEEH